MLPRFGILALGATCAFASALAAQGHRVDETEPNNTAVTANPIALGDTAYAMIAPADDSDYYAINLTAGTRLSLDVDAISIGCHLYPHVAIIDTDGKTILNEQDRVSYNDTDFDLQYHINAGGRYFIVVRSSYWTPQTDRCYRLKVGTYTLPPEGPGSPPTVVASGFTTVFGMAAHPSGDMFVIDPSCCGPESGPISRILRVTPSGSSSVFVSNERLTGGIGFDGFGDLLVTGFDGPVVNQRSVVWRFSPAGVRSVFASGFNWAYRLVVGPDGDVWVTDQGNNELKRFDALGNLKATIANVSAQDMAFSPAGDLYLSSPEAVWKLVNGTARIFYEPPHPQDVVGLAFNRDGYLYVGEPGYIDYEVSGKVVLLDPQGHSINDPFALANRRPPHNATGMLFTAFLWDGAGNMTNRLWLSSGKETGEEIIELNRSGVGAPGWPKGVNLLALDRAPLRAGVRNAEYADTLRAQNPPGSVTWTVIAGNLPPGVNLTATTGALRGVPTDTGVFAFTVRATSGSRLAFGRFTVTIGAAPPVAVSVTDVANALMGLATLTPAVVQYLDQHGNNNGVLDVGDLRAFLRAQGQLP